VTVAPMIVLATVLFPVIRVENAEASSPDCRRGRHCDDSDYVDRAELRRDRAEIREARQDLREELHDLREAIRDGDRSDIRREQRDVREARQDLREARQEYREDLQDWRNLNGGSNATVCYQDPWNPWQLSCYQASGSGGSNRRWDR
jgi:hypothetical protein